MLSFGTPELRSSLNSPTPVRTTTRPYRTEYNYNVCAFMLVFNISTYFFRVLNLYICSMSLTYCAETCNTWLQIRQTC